MDLHWIETEQYSKFQCNDHFLISSASKRSPWCSGSKSFSTAQRKFLYRAQKVLHHSPKIILNWNQNGLTSCQLKSNDCKNHDRPIISHIELIFREIKPFRAGWVQRPLYWLYHGNNHSLENFLTFQTWYGAALFFRHFQCHSVRIAFAHW